MKRIHVGTILVPLLPLAVAVCPGDALGEGSCERRLKDGLARLPTLGQRKDLVDPGKATAEVQAAFGPRAERCEKGTYSVFVEGLRDFGRAALRAQGPTRLSMAQVAIAATTQGPIQVGPEEARDALAVFRQARSTLYAIADDLKQPSPQTKLILEAFDRAGPPSVAQGESAKTVVVPPVSTGNPPPSAVTAIPPTPKVVAIRAPQAPLPTWAVLAIYEARELMKANAVEQAQAKLDTVVRWIETQE